MHIYVYIYQVDIDMYVYIYIFRLYIYTDRYTHAHIYMCARGGATTHHCYLRALGRDHLQLRGDVARRERRVARDHHEPVARPAGEGEGVSTRRV